MQLESAVHSHTAEQGCCTPFTIPWPQSSASAMMSSPSAPDADSQAQEATVQFCAVKKNNRHCLEGGHLACNPNWPTAFVPLSESERLKGGIFRGRGECGERRAHWQAGRRYSRDPEPRLDPNPWTQPGWPYMGRSNLHKQFHWHRSKELHMDGWMGL